VKAPESVIAGEFFFDPDDAIYADHFPGKPIVPGSLIIEAFMTVVRPVLEGRWKRFSVENFRFRRFISPGLYAFRVSAKTDELLQCALYDGGRTVVTGTLSGSDASC
jgi:3-hydroxyacyl-[acyl-carrier-protein] dehydratase